MTIAGSWEPLSLDLPICMPLWVQELCARYPYLNVSHIFRTNFAGACSHNQSLAGEAVGELIGEWYKWVNMETPGQVMDSRVHTCRHTCTGLIRTYRRGWGGSGGGGGGGGGGRELNTSSGSLVKRATGLAPHRLICESLLLKQLCASVHTLCRAQGEQRSRPFTH